MLYIVIVVFTMLVLPAASIAAQLNTAPLLWLVGKWFVFWAVGARLLLAGVRQYARPSFTSRDILGIDDPKAFVLVRELGGANVATGVLGVASLSMPTFVLPTALGAGIFYTVAAIEHLKEEQRGRNETIALVSDIGAAIVLLSFAATTLLTGASRLPVPHTYI